jgi:tetratricopeptide (TPR) repeat protein
MRKRTVIAALALLLAPLATQRASAACGVATIAELPVTMVNMRPVVGAKINGADARFIADSGAFFNMITTPSAAEFHLRLRPAPTNIRVTGLGGSAEVTATTVAEFTLGSVSARNVDFFVGGGEMGSDAVGVLGQNVLGLADTEYDLANGVIRLMRSQGCGNHPLAYWTTTEPSTLELSNTTPIARQTTATATVNGVKIRVLFDTGAAASMLSLTAAKRAGIDPKAAGVVVGGLSRGVGRRMVETWIAPVASFKIGDEEIRNTKLRLGDVWLENVDMLIGADFFLSHRIYVAGSQRKLYFTYNGGPVFNLATTALTQAGAAAPTPSAPKPDEAAAPTDAPGFARRGAAFAARRDFAQAIADFTRACELAPNEPSYFYQRGRALAQNKQLALARADFDRALSLAPADVPALLARAELRLAAKDEAAAFLDLDAADRSSDKQSDVHLMLAELYRQADALRPAVAQFDLWIRAHPDDSRQGLALNGRCWVRGLLDEALEKALADCDAAVKRLPKSPGALDSRGLVRLRMGQSDKAIADYDAALGQQPRSAWSLYGRGLAEMRKGMTAQGKADMAAADVMEPRVGEEAARWGLTP